MNPILLIFFLSGVGVVGDVFLKLAGNGHQGMGVKWFVLGTIVYAATAVGWFYVLRHVKLSSVGVIYALASVLILVAVGVTFFHERLSLTEVIGVVAAIVAVVLLSRFA